MLCLYADLVPVTLGGHQSVLILLEIAAIVRRQSHSSFDREFIHKVRGITRFSLLAIIRSRAILTVCVAVLFGGCAKLASGGKGIAIIYMALQASHEIQEELFCKASHTWCCTVLLIWFADASMSDTWQTCSMKVCMLLQLVPPCNHGQDLSENMYLSHPKQHKTQAELDT